VTLHGPAAPVSSAWLFVLPVHTCSCWSKSAGLGSRAFCTACAPARPPLPLRLWAGIGLKNVQNTMNSNESRGVEASEGYASCLSACMLSACLELVASSLASSLYVPPPDTAPPAVGACADGAACLLRVGVARCLSCAFTERPWVALRSGVTRICGQAPPAPPARGPAKRCLPNGPRVHERGGAAPLTAASSRGHGRRSRSASSSCRRRSRASSSF